MSLLTKMADMVQILRAVGSQGVFRIKGTFPPTNKAQLVKRNKMWAYTFAKKNAVATACIPLRLYARRRSNEPKFISPYLEPVTKDHHSYLKSLPNIHNKIAGADEVVEVTVHPFLELWSSVNENMEGFEMKELISLFQELTGDSYLWMELNGTTGRPTQFQVLMSQFVKIVEGTDRLIEGYVYGKTDQHSVALTHDEVCHFRYPNPNSQLYGLSPLEAAVRPHDILWALEEYEKTLIDNDARPDFVINYKKGQMSPERRRQLTQEWYRLLSKGGRGKPFIGSGEIDIKELGFPPREMAFLELCNWELKTLASAFDMPESFYAKSPARAISFADNVRYARFATLPRCRRQEQSLNAHVINKWDERLFVAYDNPVPADIEMDLKKAMVTLKSNGTVTKNEFRGFLGLDELDGEEGDEYIEGSNSAGSGFGKPSAEGDEGEGKIISVKDWAKPVRLKEFKNTVEGVFDRMEREVVGSIE